MADSEKRRKVYINKSNKKAKPSTIDCGLRGFLCTCSTREKDCINESYNILNKYYDQIYGKNEINNETTESSDDLEQELQELKSLNKEKRFQVVNCGAKNIVFISTTIEDPVKLAEAIITDIYESKQSQTRFLIRLVPVEVTCKAYMEDIIKACEPLLDKYFTVSPKSFSVIFNHRNNDSISRNDIIKEIADRVLKKRNDHKVNLTNPEVSIIVEIIKRTCLLSVIPNYLKYKKYNLHMASVKNSPEDKNELKDLIGSGVVQENEENKI